MRRDGKERRINIAVNEVIGLRSVIQKTPPIRNMGDDFWRFCQSEIVIGDLLQFGLYIDDVDLRLRAVGVERFGQGIGSRANEQGAFGMQRGEPVKLVIFRVSEKKVIALL